MQPPFSAYRGDDPYIFVSYAHVDKVVVYPEIELLHDRGCRIWFDEGITPAHEWSEEIAQAINACSFFLVFMTPKTAQSPYVNREIHYAVDKRKAFLVVYLEPTIPSDGLQWMLGPVQAISRYEIQHNIYLDKIRLAIPKETINSPESLPVNKVLEKRPAQPETTIREKPEEREPVKYSAANQAIDSSLRHDDSMKETINSQASPATDQAPEEEPPEPKTTFSEESNKNEPLTDSGPQWAKSSSSTYDSSLNAELLEATKAGNLSAVGELLAKEADPNILMPSGGTALIWAAADGYLDVAQLLLEKGADSNTRKPGDWTALIWAAANGHLDVTRLLLKKGADCNALDFKGRTALMMASEHGHLDVARLLLESKADPNAQQSNGWTALMMAAEYGHLDVARLLLERGADPDACNSRGWTALMSAAVRGFLDVAKLLLERGANPLLKNSDGRTAVDVVHPVIRSEFAYIISVQPKKKGLLKSVLDIFSG